MSSSRRRKRRPLLIPGHIVPAHVRSTRKVRRGRLAELAKFWKRQCAAALQAVRQPDINRHESEIVRLDLETGVQEYVSQPSGFRFIADITFDPNGQLLMGEYDLGFEVNASPPLPCSKVYRLDPATGESTVLWEPDDVNFYPNDLFLAPIPEPAMLLPLSFAFVLLPIRGKIPGTRST